MKLFMFDKVSWLDYPDYSYSAFAYSGSAMNCVKLYYELPVAYLGLGKGGAMASAQSASL